MVADVLRQTWNRALLLQRQMPVRLAIPNGEKENHCSHDKITRYTISHGTMMRNKLITTNQSKIM
jgi:hypothetical protein